MDRYHVSATGHSLNYLPEYVAAKEGYFAEEGLDYSVSVPKPWDDVLTDLAAGRADAALGGIWVPSMFRQRGKTYTPFAKIAGRAPLALVGRESAKDFSWDALLGRVVLMKGSNGASVGVFFKMLLREHGVDPQAVNFIQDLDGVMLSDLYAGGLGDYLVIDHLSAAHLSRDTGVNVVQSMTSTGGDVPWSVYYTEGALDPQRDLHTRFTRAIGRGMQWILSRSAEDYADLLESEFHGRDRGILVALADEFHRTGMWSTPKIDREAYERWQRGIAEGHLIQTPIAYDAFVDIGVASDVETLSAAD